MLILVCYDVATSDDKGPRRLRRIAELCKDYGIRVQYSVFECKLDQAAWAFLRHRLLSEFDCERDSLRFYFLDARTSERTEHHGVRTPLDVAGPLVV